VVNGPVVVEFTSEELLASIEIPLHAFGDERRPLSRDVLKGWSTLGERGFASGTPEFPSFTRYLSAVAIALSSSPLVFLIAAAGSGVRAESSMHVVDDFGLLHETDSNNAHRIALMPSETGLRLVHAFVEHADELESVAIAVTARNGRARTDGAVCRKLSSRGKPTWYFSSSAVRDPRETTTPWHALLTAALSVQDGEASAMTPFDQRGAPELST
jgi:hypothetical protein